ncbi:MAG: DUF5060 domain-containing protein [Chloroflexota bacterium]|nr:MAG: DUF5060 domain-containing protein [Chloroflexota bacterium]
MVNKRLAFILFRLLLPILVVLSGGCGRVEPVVTLAPAASPTVPLLPTPTAQPEPTPTSAPVLPKITGVDLDLPEVPRYESIEFKLSVEAGYTNPYDAREVTLDGTFKGPDGVEMTVPGFWDGETSWRVRFTPDQEGEWSYQLVIQDRRGESLPAEGKFEVAPSEKHGWLQPGSQVNPEYSGHYLVYQDGTPFYGVGHCDAFSILADGFDIERGVGLFNKMLEAGENYVVWWPLYSTSPVNSAYDKYSASNMKVIDAIVRDAQKKGIFLVFTIWDHPQLRGEDHAWGRGNYMNNNGFRNLVDVDSFFTSEEAWAWQENFYRYIIARWGFSPGIGMWQTVSEINGTNAYENTDAWHEKVNQYFIDNDPYRHPTTASMSGDTDWEAGHQAMDAPQVHVYALENDAVKSAGIIAYWTGLMWDRVEKPNWVGEFGVTGNLYYPELFHNSIWAALGAGAAMTPAEWNGGGSWMEMTPDLYADIGRLARFVADIPLAELDPSALQINSTDPEVRAWGVAGEQGGLLWVQDFSMEGRPIEEVRSLSAPRQGVQIEIQGLESGDYTLRPYDTWQGEYLEAFDVSCSQEQVCRVDLPDFVADMAFKLERK